MFVNDLPFLTTFSRDFIFGTAEQVAYQTAKQFANSLMKVVKLYTKGGFVVHNVLMDGEFQKFDPDKNLLEINISAVCDHVTEIEQDHFTLK